MGCLKIFAFFKRSVGFSLLGSQVHCRSMDLFSIAFFFSICLLVEQGGWHAPSPCAGGMNIDSRLELFRGEE